MNRREALSAVSILLGGTLVGGNIFLEGCKTDSKKEGSQWVLTIDDKSFLDEITETIIPATKTPGAKAAGVAPFIVTFVTDCYSDQEKNIFKNGLADIDKQSSAKFNKRFLEATPQQRTELLTVIDQQAKTLMDNKKKDDPTHYFRMIKELTLLGYFTSEIGSTQALRYVAIPGRYDGNVEYKSGDKAWA